MQANVFLTRHASELATIPPEGQPVRLAMAGNHSQGTMFCDGAHLCTSALESSVDEIARNIDGFYFGRFDVRYGDVQAFKEGREFAIIELNGVTSESTNIYDPSWSLLGAYRMLYKQWSIVFRIGHLNCQQGQRPERLGQLVKTVLQHYWQRRGDPISD